ncbi:MAG: hypothetical protein ACRDNI_08535, partial [Gaiellaceae bacterium]
AAGLMLAPADDDPERVAVTPWPFRPEALAVVCEGRVLRGRFADERELHEGLARAPWLTIRIELVPGDVGAES